MALTLVDSNVVLDVMTRDGDWAGWSAPALERAYDSGGIAINPIIYAEISAGVQTIEELDALLLPMYFVRLPLPWEAGFLAGKCFVHYRRRGGIRHSPLPDFYIGAHASVSRLPLLTRDAKRYRAYFPKLHLICPE